MLGVRNGACPVQEKLEVFFGRSANVNSTPWRTLAHVHFWGLPSRIPRPEIDGSPLRPVRQASLFHEVPRVGIDLICDRIIVVVMMIQLDVVDGKAFAAQ